MDGELAKCGQFSIIPARALDDERLNASHLNLLCRLGTYANKQGWCFPKLATLGGLLGVSKPTVSGWMDVLEASGYVLTQRQRRSDGGYRENRYRVLYDGELSEKYDRALHLQGCDAEPIDDHADEIDYEDTPIQQPYGAAE